MCSFLCACRRWSPALRICKESVLNVSKEYDGLDCAVSRANAEGNVSTNEYDADGRLVRSVDKEGAVTLYTCDAVDSVEFHHWTLSETPFSSVLNSPPLLINFLPAISPVERELRILMACSPSSMLQRQKTFKYFDIHKKFTGFYKGNGYLFWHCVETNNKKCNRICELSSFQLADGPHLSLCPFALDSGEGDNLQWKSFTLR